MNAPEFESWLRDPARKPLIMGVLNVTPDSFSDGGRFASVDAAVEHALLMVADGADLIDIGGESTRPGAERVSDAEQIRRVTPVLEALRGSFPAAFSIDTTRASVADAALNSGACIVNDISAGTDDPSMFPLVARRQVAVILMHKQGTPHTMQVNPQYADVVGEVTEYLRQRVTAACIAGIAAERIVIDPGIGFGKSFEHNLELLRRLAAFKSLNQPMLVGTSRKSFLGTISGQADPSARQFATAASVGWCVANGADIVRVHDVGSMRQVVDVVRAIRGTPLN